MKSAERICSVSDSPALVHAFHVRPQAAPYRTAPYRVVELLDGAVLHGKWEPEFDVQGSFCRPERLHGGRVTRTSRQGSEASVPRSHRRLDRLAVLVATALSSSVCCLLVVPRRLDALGGQVDRLGEMAGGEQPLFRQVKHSAGRCEKTPTVCACTSWPASAALSIVAGPLARSC